MIITEGSDGRIVLCSFWRAIFARFLYISQAPHSPNPIVVSGWNWVTAEGSVACLINLIRERHRSSETREVRDVTSVKTRQLNGSRPFACLPWESACAGSGTKCSLQLNVPAADVPSIPATRSALSCRHANVTPPNRVGKPARVTRSWVLVFDSGHVHWFHHWPRGLLRSVMLCGF
jgi:hypothetical protein